MILEAALQAGDYVEMGFLFSQEISRQKFDGLLITSTPYSTAPTYEVVYTSADLWTTERPFTDGKVDFDSPLEKESAYDWNITSEKSKLTCPDSGTGRCIIHAHWNRKFETGDPKDI